MKQAKKQLLFLLFAALLLFPACGTSPGTTEKEPAPPVSQESTPVEPLPEESPREADTPKDSQKDDTLKVLQETDTPENLQKAGTPKDSQAVPDLSDAPFSPEKIAPYESEAYVIVNGNLPYFAEKDLTTRSYEVYSELDQLGRCGTAYANIGPDLMPIEERGSIGEVRPSGWHTVKYDTVDGNYLYNRCHLIGYQLSGENANEKNLITGTRYLNVQGMLPFENMVADYVKETGNHVLYRVTPIYEGDNLVASGVLMEAESVEDKGEDILFCVYVYNVQPGIAIDYATGESALASEPEIAEPEPVASATESEASAPESEVSATEPGITEPEPVVSATEPQSSTYILNTNTKKFHIPSCSSVKQMKDSNKEEYTGSREDVIARGYDPCKRCHP